MYPPTCHHPDAILVLLSFKVIGLHFFSSSEVRPEVHETFGRRGHEVRVHLPQVSLQMSLVGLVSTKEEKILYNTKHCKPITMLQAAPSTVSIVNLSMCHVYIFAMSTYFNLLAEINLSSDLRRHCTTFLQKCL